MGVFIIVIISVALLSFIIDPTTLQSTLSMFSKKHDVGMIDGNRVTYQDFSKKVQYYTNVQQLLGGSAGLSEENSDRVNNTAWQEFISEFLVEPAIAKSGIALGNEELFDLAQGDEISPVLQADPVFRNPQTGAFDKEALLTFIKNISSDPSGNMSLYWDFLEKNMGREQLMAKYASLLTKSVVKTPVELRRDMEENNQTASVDFVLTPLSFAPDSTLSVSAAEIKEYYNQHKDNYQQEATRDFEYVVFDVVPSEKDLADAQADAEKYFAEFGQTTTMRQFLARNSDAPFDEAYYKAGELTFLSTAIDEWAATAAVDEVLPIAQDGITYRAARVMDVKQLPDSVNVYHIMLQRPDKAEATRVADSLLQELKKGADFAALATAFSSDVDPSREPGALGWMTRGTTIPGFEPCFEMEVNKPVVMETQYGVHVIKITEKTKLQRKAQVAVLVKNTLPGKETFQTYYSQANDLASQCKNGDDFRRLVAEKGLMSTPAMAMPQNARNLGAYTNAREVIRWAFDNKPGSVSPVISVNNEHFFVAHVTGVHERGIATLAERQTEIVNLLTMEKKMDKLMAKVQEDLQGVSDIHAYAEKVGLTVSSRSGLAFGSPMAQQLDPKLMGAIAGAEEKVLTGPVRGTLGVYVFQVTGRDTGAFYTEDDAKRADYRSMSYQSGVLVNALMDINEVVDNRAKFF